jgi:hypothetical protein
MVSSGSQAEFSGDALPWVRWRVDGRPARPVDAGDGRDSPRCLSGARDPDRHLTGCPARDTGIRDPGTALGDRTRLKDKLPCAAIAQDAKRQEREQAGKHDEAVHTPRRGDLRRAAGAGRG